MGAAVWLIATTFEPRGASTYTLRLASHLPEFGYDPVILCESVASAPARYRRTLRFIESPPLRGQFLGPWRIRRFLREVGLPPPALIHAQRRYLDRVAIQFARILERPYLLTVHDIMANDETLAVAPEWLGGVIAISPTVERDLVLNAGAPASIMRVIPNGVDLPDNPKLPGARSGNRIPIVGVASALEPAKGLTYFLMAAELILSSGYDVEFLIAGSGPDEETLRRAAQHLDISNRVTFVPYLSEYVSVLETIDVFVLPSVEQGLGTVALEAMAIGKPVVATQVGGIADFLMDGEHALLAPAANHIILAEKIKQLLDNPERARKLALSGQRLVRESFSVERMTRDTAQFYGEALESFSRTAEPSVER